MCLNGTSGMSWRTAGHLVPEVGARAITNRTTEVQGR